MKKQGNLYVNQTITRDYFILNAREPRTGNLCYQLIGLHFKHRKHTWSLSDITLNLLTLLTSIKTYWALVKAQYIEL